MRTFVRAITALLATAGLAFGGFALADAASASSSPSVYGTDAPYHYATACGDVYVQDAYRAAAHLTDCVGTRYVSVIPDLDGRGAAGGIETSNQWGSSYLIPVDAASSRVLSLANFNQPSL